MAATRIDRGSTETTTIYSDGTELVFERTFDAPSEQVWKAFTDPEIVPRWWGKRGKHDHGRRDGRAAGRSVALREQRPGSRGRGLLRRVSRGQPPSGFRWTFMFDVEGLGPQGGPETHTFEDLGGRTKIRSVGHFDSVESIDGALATGMVGGAIETWDRLAEVLAAS